MISVVIPLYNKQESIVATLQSVLAQTYTDYEIVVVDDGSTDNSARVVEEFIREAMEFNGQLPMTNRPSIRLIRKENGGVSSARNRGIIEAKGEYIAFLDGDDLWNEKYLETLHLLICDYPGASIYGIGCAKVRDGEVKYAISLTDIKRGYVEDVWNNYSGCWTGSSSCSSKTKLLEAGLFDTRLAYGEDIDMWWRLLLLADGVIDNRIFAYYRQDAENRAMNKLIPLEKHLPYYMDKYVVSRKNDASFRKFFDREMIYILYPYLFVAQYKKQAKKIAKQLDYRLQKWSMRLRMICPYLYRFYQMFKSLVKISK
jgi:glycosyltransferase involved in cell wall biosynthesis